VSLLRSNGHYLGHLGEGHDSGRVARAPMCFLPVPELWVPRPCVLGKGGYGAACTMGFVIAQRPASHSPALYHLFVLPAIAFSAHGAQLRLLPVNTGTDRQRYRFVVVGYVVMPEHIHLLITTEPEAGTPSTVMQVLKQRTARACCRRSGVRTHASAACLQTRLCVHPSGSLVSTTSMYGRQRSGWRSSGICTAIR